VAAHHCRVGKRTGLITPTRLLEEIHERLAGVVIECLPWHEFLERYDAPSILMGGAPRSIAIVNGTLAAALGIGLRFWVAETAMPAWLERRS
jgi:hypothetical protein